LNLYGFTLNNPINWIDSDGRATIIPNQGGRPTATNPTGSPSGPGGPSNVPNVTDPPSPPPTPENFPPQGPSPFEQGDGSNCYNFACNRPYDPFDNWPPRNWIPGQGSFGTTQYMSCDDLIKRVIADGGIEPGEDGCCPYGYHKIRPFVEPVWGWNFHFYRQDDDGGWGEKPGAQRPNRVDDPNVYNGPTRPLVYLRRMLEGTFPANILDYWDRGLDFVPYERCPDLCVPD